MNYIQIIIYVLLGFTPGLAWLLFFLRQDKKRPEPIGMLWRAFIWGMIITFPAVIIEYALLESIKPLILNQILLNILAAFLIIAPAEEILKYFVFKYRIFKAKVYDEPIDAMIYMITIAMGFASVENIILVLRNLDDPWKILILRFLSATLVHALAGGIIGFYLGKVKQKKVWKTCTVAMGIFYAIIFHGAYDAIILWQSDLVILAIAGLLVFVSVLVSWQFKILKT
tara:strand:+ start:61 stop:741 length:681 start_codon:yes stop_codon:yes gene_type:complete